MKAKTTIIPKNAIAFFARRAGRKISTRFFVHAGVIPNFDCIFFLQIIRRYLVSIAKFGIIILFILLVTCSGYSQNNLLPEKLIVKQVSLSGIKQFLPIEIFQLLQTKPIPFLLFWEKPTYYDSNVLQQDMQKILQHYQDFGYYDTKITPSYTIKKNKYIFIKLQVQEGPPVIVKKIDIFNDAALKESLKKLLYHNILLRENKQFTNQQYLQSKKNILEILGNNGYYFATVEGKVLIDKMLKQAKVEFYLDAGPHQSFGQIYLVGNRKTRAGLILRELTFNTDEEFSYEKLYQSQKNIFQLGFFNSVVLEPVYQLEQPAILNVYIKVEENPWRSLKFGPGYGSEDRFRMQALWQYRNFLKLGGNLEINSKYSHLVHKLEATHTQPYFSDRKTSFLSGLAYQKDFLEIYDKQKTAVLTRLRRNITPNFNTFFGYQVERDLLFNVATTMSSDPEENLRRKFTLSYFEVGGEYKTTEEFFNPHQGTIAGVSWEFTPQYLGSNVTYLRGLAEWKYFYPLNENIILALRSQLGYVRPIFDSSSVPIFKRFFAGGSHSVRGYAYQRLGPMDGKDNPIGGNSLWEGNIEIRFPLYHDLQSVIFYDFGEVFTQTKHYSLNNLRTTTGIGFRYNTIIGPIRLDYGYKLKPRQGEDLYHIYFSIGQAF